ncbi:MAG: hypothetical protein BWY83_02273 [bacterium ADurb.Bin478]|nr:MAG: hypothetical protein BWY83_02273 [bacterium ADurb.Bin478]
MTIHPFVRHDFDLVQHIRFRIEHTGIIHDLCQTQHPLFPQEREEIKGPELGTCGFQGRCGHARREHKEDVEWIVFAGLHHVADSLVAEYIGDLVRISDHRSRTQGHYRSGELRHLHHGAFDVHVAVDKARRQIQAREVRFLLSGIASADADDRIPVNGDIGLFDLAGEDIDHPAVLEHQSGFDLAACCLDGFFEHEKNPHNRGG